MRILRPLTIACTVLIFTACASNPSRMVRSEFEDIPVPKGLSYVGSKSTVIESPSVKAARLVYRGRLERDSLAIALRSTLEANGWRHVGTTASAAHGINQTYAKDANSLQVLLWEGIYYTYVELTASRALPPPPAQAQR
ncbi:MAG: hypothetical protein HYR86_03355 [Candidatus Rokubacteria bacterium]|nr:hypothetical protein [Candidatus Rokubacteria bacterium]